MASSSDFSFQTAYALAVRDLRSRYARSFLGPLWLFFTPLLLLAVYYFVFGVALKVEWKAPDGSPVSYVTPFFCGLVLYLYFADVIGSALALFVGKRNYIQRTSVSLMTIWFSFWIRTTLQFLPTFLILWIVASTLGHFSIIGLVGSLLTVLVYAFVMMAVSLPLAALGPFFNDLSQTVSPLMRALFYTAPITFPLTFIPERFRAYFFANPLTLPTLELRESVVFGQWPNFISLGLLIAAAAVVGLFGLGLLMRLERVIPDVV